MHYVYTWIPRDSFVQNPFLRWRWEVYALSRSGLTRSGEECTSREPVWGQAQVGDKGHKMHVNASRIEGSESRRLEKGG